jgi:hypothetical protein
MTEQDAEELFQQINIILRNIGLTWLATQIAAEAAEGRASPKMVSVEEHIDTGLFDEMPTRPARRKTEFTHVRPLTSKEKVDVSITALRAIIVSSGKILPEVLGTLNAAHAATISFASETDSAPTVLTEIEASRVSRAVLGLDEQLRSLIEEVHRGS